MQISLDKFFRKIEKNMILWNILVWLITVTSYIKHLCLVLLCSDDSETIQLWESGYDSYSDVLLLCISWTWKRAF